MAILRAALLLALAAAAAIVLVSGGSDADPRTPPALPGQPPPFLGTAISGTGLLTAAVDAYGDVVDLRAPGAAGRALIDNPAARQAAGTVPADTGIVPRIAIGGGPAEPLWRADSVSQRYERDTNVVRTVARFGGVEVVVRTAAGGVALAMTVAARSPRGVRAVPSIRVDVSGGARCDSDRRPDGALTLICGPSRVPPHPVETVFDAAIAGSRNWLARARPLGAGAPPWARATYRRSLLVLQALTDPEAGAVAAGARDGWAYVWPRDAATVALALDAAGYRGEARRIARFLDSLPLTDAARFEGNGSPVPGRAAQGDAAGWVAVADRALGLPPPPPPGPGDWRDRPDYQEGSAGDYLGNALAARAAAGAEGGGIGGAVGEGRGRGAVRRGGAVRRDGAALRGGAPRGGGAAVWGGGTRGIGAGRNGVAGGGAAPDDDVALNLQPPLAAFRARGGLVRGAGDPASGLDSAAAWAVRPFATPALYPAAERTLLRLARHGGRFGITPGEGWSGGEDPWTAPTAAGAWALAALGDRAAALHLLADLRRAATPAGDLPERVDAQTGIPRSTTPLAWSHAFTVLTLRQLWP